MTFAIRALAAATILAGGMAAFAGDAAAIPSPCKTAAGLPCAAKAGDTLAGLGPKGGHHVAPVIEAAIKAATGTFHPLKLIGKTGDHHSPKGKNKIAPAHVTNIEKSFSGEWRELVQLSIFHVSVKAANSFAVYAFDPDDDWGTHSPAGMHAHGGKPPTGSHLSFWNTCPPDGNGGNGGNGGTVPEPTSAGLLAAALLGLGLRRRRRNAR